ncbi:fructose-specific PTS transporter subunit EIIC [Georgenia sp. TF02-10]|uniref:PTS fructose transporter subunit IIABC n=1 Tax=Georgenia sp. TF02-10 TaxID=2917725 RepID=UPI001FA711FC|nr:fructose-specific PTS transporter subunit EIIC [Georgenia sp. TF02-10]UNX53852.1 fructose-specific PTS transporter subunit EIIC [Georgenia sp. TF02-10]
MSQEAPPLITAELVALDVDLGTTKDDVIAALARTVAAAGRADADQLLADAMAREAQSATGVPGGIAIPHCRSAGVHEGSLAFARLSPAVDFGAPDGPADLVFLIAAAEGGGADHLKLLTKLARALVRKDFVAALRAAGTPVEVVALVDGVLDPAPAPPATGRDTTAATREQAGATSAQAGPAADQAGGDRATERAGSDQPPAAAAAGDRHRVVAVTACPTGIAHTYMAADALVAAGRDAGVDVEVETQGSSATTPLPPETIAAADAVIFATDVNVKGRERFAGKPVVESAVKRAINEPGAMIAEALRAAEDPGARRVAGAAGTGEAAGAGGGTGGGGLGVGARLKQALLTGVSYMIPFVAAGGLIIALGFLFGGYDITSVSRDIVLNSSLVDLPDGGFAQYLGAVLYELGSAAFSFLVPALAGYIAFGLADRPGIAPGFTAGAVANIVGAGFLGGMLGGLLAGAAALAISRIDVPRWLRGLMPVVIIPLLASIASGGLIFLLGQPLGAIMTGLTSWLGGMSGASAVILGIILGLMMCFDLGGPVNKAAYTFATAGLVVTDPATMRIMAAVMAAGMVPPLAMALTTAVRPRLFTPVERENGNAAWLLGASFISEGALPFAAADLRIIPPFMAGGALTGALAMALDAQSRAPHGGIFVFFAMDNVLGFVLAVVAGTVLAAVLVIAVKEWARRRGATADVPAPVAAAAA